MKLKQLFILGSMAMMLVGCGDSAENKYEDFSDEDLAMFAYAKFKDQESGFEYKSKGYMASNNEGIEGISPESPDVSEEIAVLKTEKSLSYSFLFNHEYESFGEFSRTIIEDNFSLSTSPTEYMPLESFTNNFTKFEYPYSGSLTITESPVVGLVGTYEVDYDEKEALLLTDGLSFDEDLELINVISTINTPFNLLSDLEQNDVEIERDKDSIVMTYASESPVGDNENFTVTHFTFDNELNLIEIEGHSQFIEDDKVISAVSEYVDVTYK